MSHVELDLDIEDRLAQMCVPYVVRLARSAQDGARAAAPAVKHWTTMLDEKVRPWHRSAHGQAVPDNLRFIMEHSPIDEDPHPFGNEFLREPRDPNGSRLQTQWCRCSALRGEELRDSIDATGVGVAGPIARAEVATRFPRAAESNFGTLEDIPTHFMEHGARAAHI